ncbi:hypothetical protein [Psychroserpens jangbogonensis]|uniref:hypothetical protein n=1 Tax=Psychroserpens jangbogonensis TaxID=1484460 RepID=UPI00053F2239|nr:hypothetical protein [Psychroserpens jangbogonensis]
MRFFKLNGKINLKYIFGELLLLFVGINLAIWFNNWNSSKKTNESKAIAISKITEEVENNKLEIDIILKNNHQVLNAYKDFKNLYDGKTSIIIASPRQLQLQRKRHPGFFKTKDSVTLANGLYRYRGKTQIKLEIRTLTEIAWKTTTTLNVTNEFNYECLYELESMYNLQRRVQLEINKSADALQKGELEEIMSILSFMNQLGGELQNNYDSVKKNIQNCS